MAGRPDRLVVVVGTGTEIGKTWVTARLAEVLTAAGHRVWARKPAQSFDPGDDPAFTDAAVLAAATGELPSTVCPEHRWYPLAMAPPMAARALGRPAFTLRDLVAEIQWPHAAPPPGVEQIQGDLSVGVVETAGGVRSPQADDGDGLALLGLLAPDAVVLVADAGLGTIHSVRLCLDALASTRPGVEGSSDRSQVGPEQVSSPAVVVLNRFDPTDALHVANRQWLEEHDGVHVVVTPGEEDLLAAWVVARPGAGRPMG